MKTPIQDLQTTQDDCQNFRPSGIKKYSNSYDDKYGNQEETQEYEDLLIYPDYREECNKLVNFAGYCGKI